MRIKNFVGAATCAVMAAISPFAASAAEQPKQLTIFSGPQGGSWYPMAGGLAKLFADAGVRSNAEVGAGISNVVVVSQGRGELGFTMTVVPAMAAKGEEPFKEPINNVKGIANLGNNMVQMLVRKDAGVDTVADLKGKKFGSQPVGAVTAEALKAALAAYGLSEGDLEITRGSQSYGANETKDRRIVGYTATSNPPTASFTEVAETMDVKFLPISDEAFQLMKKQNAGFVRAEIPANSYNGQTEAVPTASTALILMTSDNLSEEEGYWVTKTLVDNIDKLRNLHGQLRNVTVEDLAKVEGLELHPGAKRYYEEVGAL